MTDSYWLLSAKYYTNNFSGLGVQYSWISQGGYCHGCIHRKINIDYTANLTNKVMSFDYSRSVFMRKLVCGGFDMHYFIGKKDNPTFQIYPIVGIHGEMMLQKNLCIGISPEIGFRISRANHGETFGLDIKYGYLFGNSDRDNYLTVGCFVKIVKRKNIYERLNDE